MIKGKHFDHGCEKLAMNSRCGHKPNIAQQSTSLLQDSSLGSFKPYEQDDLRCPGVRLKRDLLIAFHVPQALRGRR
jgi:hypothetical protein